VAARFVAEDLSPEPARWSRVVQGLVLSSPALALDVSPVQRLLLLLGRLSPDRPTGNGLDPNAICRDPRVVQAYRDDPLVHDRITPRLAQFLLDAGEFVRGRAARWATPTLLLWAGADRCVAPRGSAAFAAEAPAAVVSAHACAGLYHEIFNEPEKDQVFDTVRQWLDHRDAMASPHAPAS
jgi:alpha-beta hydrolase superfamily lysophospholipase